ncbi:MAG: PAS domain-containing protein [Candidatus Marinimicrobia bacterium]|nr:PAS domain-containing protein [Candidatus Neomarinimicrobiota bacterium]
MSDKSYQQLFNSLNIPIILLNASGTIIDVNPAFVSMLRGKKDEIIGKALENVFAGIISQKAITALLNGDNQATEITLQHSESLKSFYVNCTASQEKDGQAVRFIIFNEKTEPVELKKRINNLENDLQNETRFSVFGHLFPGIAHNINNPLAVIIGRSQLLSIKHPEITELASIRDQAGLIKSIIDALSFKIDRESLDKEAPVNIGDLLRYELTVLNADPFYKHKVQKRINLDGSTPLVKGFYNDFSTALLTVINYSLDSLLSVEKKLFTISTQVDSDYIIVTICDSGTMAESGAWDQGQPSYEIFQSPRMGQHIINLGRAYELITKYGGKIALIKNEPDGKEFQIKIPY